MTIRAVRATPRGNAAVAQILTEKAVYLNGARRWEPTDLETAVIVTSPSTDYWTPLGMILHRINQVLPELCRREGQLSDAIRSLERDGMVEVFREFSEATILIAEINGWTFNIRWDSLRRQMTRSVKSDDVKDKIARFGFCMIGELKVSLE